MKKLLYPFVACILIFILSCSSDPCDGVDCVNGDCVDGTCICDNGFTGANCDQVLDPCAGISCNNGNCVNGACECDPGYEGEFCDKTSRDKFIGDWTGLFNKCFDTEVPILGNLADILEVDITEESTMTVTENPDDTGKINIEIEGFALGEDPLSGVVDGNMFTIDELEVDAMGFTVTISGGGELTSDSEGVVTLLVNDATGFVMIDCQVDITKE